MLDPLAWGTRTKVIVTGILVGLYEWLVMAFGHINAIATLVDNQ